MDKHSRYNRSVKGRLRNLKYEWKRRYARLQTSIDLKEQRIQQLEDRLVEIKRISNV